MKRSDWGLFIFNPSDSGYDNLKYILVRLPCYLIGKVPNIEIKPYLCDCKKQNVMGQYLDPKRNDTAT
jgi:hypothetical protein